MSGGQFLSDGDARDRAILVEGFDVCLRSNFKDEDDASICDVLMLQVKVENKKMATLTVARIVSSCIKILI